MLYTYLLKMINETKKEIFRNGIVRRVIMKAKLNMENLIETCAFAL